MKLLLTSAGITNKSIENALLGLLGKPFKESKLVFIPTAADVEQGDKGWLIDDLKRLKDLEFSQIDIVDISAIPRELWLPRLETADVLVLGGGNTWYLMSWLKKSGLADVLPEFLKTKVYVGISAGSILTSKKFSLLHLIYPDEDEFDERNGLGLVDFEIRPHLNSPFFPKSKDAYLGEATRLIPDPVYAIDDETAIKVIDGKIEIISEGKYLMYNLK